jgi:tetratricopeptide (TPR) repeat protein
MRFVCMCGLAVLLAHGAAAETAWIVARSPHYELLTTAKADKALDLLRHLETVREFFGHVIKQHRDTGPVRLVAFTTTKQYLPYRPGKRAAAYFHSTNAADWIVLGDINDQTARIATHEFIHLLMGQPGLDLPLWLNEGLAECYSTFRTVGGKARLGDLLPGTLQNARMQKWIPIQELLKVGTDSPIYRDSRHGGMFHTESWLLVHMLHFEPEYAPRFNQLLSSLAEGGDSARMLEERYGMRLAALDSRLQGYLRGSEFHAGVLATPIERNRAEVQTERAPEWYVKLSLAELLIDHEEGLRRMRLLHEQMPRRPEVAAALGLRLLQKGNSSDGETMLEEAYDGGLRENHLLWSLGRSPRATVKRREEALTRLIELDPQRLPARLALARLLLGQERAVDAYAIINPVRRVTPKQAPDYFQLLAELAIRRGDRAEALRALGRIETLPVEESRKTEARRLIADMSQPERKPAPAAPGSHAGARAGERLN